MTAVGSLRSIVLECAEPAPLAEFWAAVLDRPVVQRDDDWWALERRPGEARMCFQVVDAFEPPAWPGEHGEQQAHLDVEVDDLDVARTAVLGLGARRLGDVVEEPDDRPWQVFADPAGHPFCLVT
ncbi:VOC family protein [Aeromicrobium fastidiosum]|uniref:VOC family protein n=1 Tax=Aeromicrobium fastidiosum TaxID=52699 RepID=UPI0020233E55|nr:VOC family protein [Aeromicrobium fastidiosum]MCL8252853.1 VOC family protein [Aeromicrobium fastidiosum]